MRPELPGISCSAPRGPGHPAGAKPARGGVRTRQAGRDSWNRQQAVVVVRYSCRTLMACYSKCHVPAHTEWTAGAACTATAGAAEPARIDPAAPSARMTGMRARLMRMIPPWHLYSLAACCMTHEPTGAAELYVSYCQYLAFMHQGKPSVRVFQILKFHLRLCL